jgi:16S rRNA (uracil1498-N3)-methyltransferase
MPISVNVSKGKRILISTFKAIKRTSTYPTMSLPYFFEPDLTIAKNHFTLSEESSKHCIQVLRMKMGEQLQLINGKGLICAATIVSEDKRKTVVLLQESISTNPPTTKVILGISLLKNPSRFEWLLEKATEIGVTEIQPLICKRTEHTRFRQDRMQGIIIAAMLQSQQTWLPILQTPASVDSIITHSTNNLRLIAHCEPGNKPLINQLPLSKAYEILIGPEGDFTSDEIKLAIENKYEPISLGATRLRTETAGMVAATLLMNK